MFIATRTWPGAQARERTPVLGPMIGVYTIRNDASTRLSFLPFAGEAEPYGLVKAAAVALGQHPMLVDSVQRGDAHMFLDGFHRRSET